MTTKKLYLAKDKIFEITLIPLKKLPAFKRKYKAILNEQLSQKASNKYRKITIYDLKNQKVLEESRYEAMMCTKDCIQTLYDPLIAEKRMRIGPYVDQNFLSKIDMLIQELADFVGVDIRKLDKSPESMKIVSDFFEEFYLSFWISDDFNHQVVAYFGEVIRQKYPQAKWEMDDSYNWKINQPYIRINSKIREDFFLDITKYLGGVIEDYELPTIYERLQGAFNVINYQLNDK